MIKAIIGITALLVGLTGPQVPAQAHEYVNPNDGYKACMYATLTNRFNDTDWRKASREIKTFWKAAAHKNCK
jgi:hypothetical protein